LIEISAPAGGLVRLASRALNTISKADIEAVRDVCRNAIAVAPGLNTNE
jgi:hypothetical protein